MHAVALYEIGGWICSSISIAGFPPSFLVLAGPDAHLDDFYIAIYDDEEDEFHYLKLPNDCQSPLVALPLEERGDFTQVFETYHLKPKEF
jgi:hypothetical protein